MSSYTVYCIKGNDKNGPFEIYRRYNEFHALREVMVQKWPGCFVPSIPPKTLMGKNDKSVVLARSRALNFFCISVSENPNLYYSKEFCDDFLRSKESDLAKYLQSQPQEPTKKIVERYKSVFAKLDGVSITKEIPAAISSFHTFLKNAKSQLSNLKSSLKTISEMQRLNNIYQSQLFEQQLPLYEKTCFQQYVDHDELKLLLTSTQSHTEEIKALKNSVKQFSTTNSMRFLEDMISFELRDCEAFYDLIELKNDYVKKQISIDQKIKSDQEDLVKLQQGKSTFKSLVSSSEEAKKKLEASIQQNKEELECITYLNDLILVIIGTIEIEKFKQQKQRWYRKVLASLSHCELVCYMSFMELWQKVYELSGQLQDK